MVRRLGLMGYHDEHAFALNWNAMKGYHYLMRMAPSVNTLARFSRHLKALYAELGVRGGIAFIRQSCVAPWLDPERVRTLLSQPFQLPKGAVHASRLPARNVC